MRRTHLLIAIAVSFWSAVVAGSQAQTGAEFYLKRGEDFSGVRQFDRAIAEYTTAITLKPEYAEAYNDRGFAHYLKGDAEAAIADYTRAIELRPDYPKAYNNRGVAYMAHGYGSAKSVPDFDRAIALKPDFRYAYINRANARGPLHPWLALQDFHRAGMYPEQTVAIFGGAVAIMLVGIAWIRRKRLREASPPDMHRSRILMAIGVSLWSAVVAGSQPTPSGALSAALRTHLQAERFDIVTSVRGLPLGVRDLMQKMFGTVSLDIAEPGAAFQATDVILKPGLPIRRLVAAGCSADFHCLVYYERGGIASTRHVMLFHWTPAESRFEWGGVAPGGLATVDDVRNAILSGAIKGQAGPW